MRIALKPEMDVNIEREVNAGMLDRVVYALEKHSSSLKFVVFPSGTRVCFPSLSREIKRWSAWPDLAKAYGIYNPGGVFKAPLKETMVPTVETFGGKLHYHAYADLLTEKSIGKSWTWCDVRPDAVVGFVPGGSAFNLTAHWGTYLAMYAVVEGKGAKVHYPGTEPGMRALYNEASADMIGRLSIWASLHPEISSGQIFNVADRVEPSSQKERWPRIAAYFGLEGIGPPDEGVKVLTPSEYMEKHRDILVKQGVKPSVVFYGAFLDGNFSAFTFDRHLDMARTRAAGFLDEVDPSESWFKAFDRYRAAGMLPK